MTEWEPAFSWRNVGLFYNRLDRFWSCGALTPWGNLIVKPWSQRLFSERYGQRESMKLLGLSIKWARLRRYHPSLNEEAKRIGE